MNTEEIIKVAIAIVGVTQIIKSFIPLKRKGICILVTILVGIGICLLQHYIPTVVTPLIAISGATIFYDTIYQTFEKLFKRKEDECV